MRLVRAELLKIRSTNTWWTFGLIALGLWAVTLFFNYIQTQFLAGPDATTGMPEDQAEQLRAAGEPVSLAANLYTNGQFLGLVIVLVLGVLVVTNEFHHQTVTTTFLTTPHRTAVVVAKLVAAALLGALFWVVTTGLNLLTGPLILNAFDVANQLDKGEVWQAIWLNGLAYLLWAIFGVGFGVLIRSQIGATVTAILLYFAGFIGAAIFFSTLATRFGDWINDLQVLVPSLASQLMVSAVELPSQPPQWLGAVVLIGYAVLTAGIGTLMIRKRDIS
ncbi:ABC transporter permease subunit [Plantactinospora soyae]|uniref:ABC-type transport system involved in multi-copper enzyme maturation permease subunit n=1 Tax=Plantactinospora soyae TaxID=1544732 RepID=A0A927M2X1_9ACTN|nr:ABC transporter permease subunit [Plantactinospora soyae]MBE1487188.1 ABC-type transport system involved in multi-copper enzyme maturation permease subunit [Plantactinospora soyae]